MIPLQEHPSFEAIFQNRISATTKKLRRGLKSAASGLSSVASEAVSILSGATKSEILDKPPVPRLLHSNDVPDDLEENIIRSYIHAASQQRDTILLSGHDLTTTQKLLLKKIDGFISKHKAILSPVRRLPPEVLHIIFDLVQDRAPSLVQFRAPLGIDSRWALSQVSQYWRACSLSSPSLWSTLPIVKLSGPQADQPKIISLLSAYIDRSGNTPLTVQFLEDNRYGMDSRKDPILKFLSGYSERWRNLTITATAVTLTALGSIRNQLTSLESLTLWMVSGPIYTVPIIDVFRTALRLKFVFIDGSKYDGSIILPSRQLRYLHTTCKNTKLDDGRNGAHGKEPTLTLRLLTSLELHHLTRAAFLDSLVLPALEKVSIVSCEMSVSQSLSNMLSRTASPYTVKKLEYSIHKIGDFPGALAALLRKVPGLTRLSAFASYAEDVLAIASLDPDTMLLPDLTHCTFTVSTPLCDEAAVCQAITQLALSRCQSFGNDIAFPATTRQSFQQLVVRIAKEGWATYPTLHATYNRQIMETNLQQCKFEHWCQYPLLTTPPTKMDDLKWDLYLAPRADTGLISIISLSKIMRYHKNRAILYNVENPRYIIKSNLHYYFNDLRRMSDLIPTSKPDGYGRKEILAQIDEILQKWEVLFESIVDELHWAYDNEHSETRAMIFIPDSHEIRKSPREAAKLFLYGFNRRDPIVKSYFS